MVRLNLRKFLFGVRWHVHASPGARGHLNTTTLCCPGPGPGPGQVYSVSMFTANLIHHSVQYLVYCGHD